MRQTKKLQDIFTKRYRARKERLSPSLRLVADFIDQNRLDVMTRSAFELAKAIGTSDATVVRAVKALGFDGLADLRHKLANAYGHGSAPAENLTRTLANVGVNAGCAMNRVLDNHIATISALQTEAFQRAMNDALAVLHNAKRIAIFGIGPTAHIAGYFSNRLRRKGRRQFLLDKTGTMLADQLLDLEKGDALLMLTYGRAHYEAETAMTEARRLNLPIILITDSNNHTLLRKAKVVVNVGRGESGHFSMHGATVVGLEMLLLGLAQSDHINAVGTLRRLERLRTATGPKVRPMLKSALDNFDDGDDHP